MAFIPLSLRCGRYTIADLSPIISAIGLFTVLFLFTYDHLDREITGTGGYLGSITVPRPLSRFDTHPQAKLKTFETKMAAITQSARSQRYLWKKWGTVNSPITNADPNLVSSKRCGSLKVLPRVQNSLTERKTMHKYAKYIFSSLYVFFVRN